ncbi:MAG: FtsW/RodA/SpoVE family cell cycle protein [bacterium JZ-2024 1]
MFFAWINLLFMEGKWTAVVQNQLMWMAVSLVIFLFFHWMKETRLNTIGWYGFVIFSLLLVFVLFTPSIRGSRRWMDLGFIQFQPSELLKPFYAFALAHFAARWERMEQPFFFYARIGLFSAVPFVLIFLEPDLGTSLIYLAGAFFLIPGYPRFHRKHFFLLFLLVSAWLPLFWFFLKPYQRERIVTFFNPLQDPLGKGYQVLQSRVFIGAGSWWGLGWNEETRRILSFFPGRKNDFFFSVLAGVYGFFGSLILLLIFFYLFLRMWEMGLGSADVCAQYFLLAYSGMFFFQSMVHILVCLGLFPTTGIPLPLMSAGGSHLLSEAVGFGFASWYRVYYEEEFHRKIEREVMWKKMIK